MRLKRGATGKRKSGKKGNITNKRKSQWGDEDNDDDVENISRGDPGLSDEESQQLAKRRPPPRQTREKCDKLYRVMKKQKELDVRTNQFNNEFKCHVSQGMDLFVVFSHACFLIGKKSILGEDESSCN